MVPKLLEAMFGSAKGRGSRRVQFACIAMLIVVMQPSLAWPAVGLASVLIAALTATDLAQDSS